MADLCLSQFLKQSRKTQHHAAVTAIVEDVAQACIAIAQAIERGALTGSLGNLDTENVQGEVQKELDVIANQLLMSHLQQSGHVAGVASEEMDDIVAFKTKRGARTPCLVLFDPLDGSSNIDLNVAVGTIFSVLSSPSKTPQRADFLQSGHHQLCAGYAFYGSSTMLVLSLGQGVHGFSLDKTSNTFYLTHPDLQIPPQTQEFAVNVSNYRFWQAPVQRYVDECMLGKVGEHGKDFNMRWVASMVAEVHRILVRGGIFMYPGDSKPATQQGKLRLMYEASPMSFLVEQAGGAASTDTMPILAVIPDALHQRVPVFLGSRDEVARLMHYHQQPTG